MISKPRIDPNPNEGPPRSIRQWIQGHDVDEIEAVIPDMTGIARGKLIPAKKYSEEVGLRMPVSYTHLTLPTKRIV